MPSPLAHAAAGYAIYKVLTRHRLLKALRYTGPISWTLVIIVTLSFLPDFDFLPGIIIGDYDAFHNSYSNSLFIGFGLALLAGLSGGLTNKNRFIPWFLAVFLAYELHVIMDYFGNERGTMLLWPMTVDRFHPPIKLFFGFHRSDGLWSINHLWTVMTEAGFAILIFILINIRKLGKVFSTLAGDHATSRVPREKSN